MATFFTSDLHFGHVRIIELCNRPFSSIDEMNNELTWRWNCLVDPGDRVYILGDLALGSINDSLRLVEKLNGIKYLVPGNHDRCWTGNKRIRPVDILRYTDIGVHILPEDFTEERGWRLSHFPYSGDSHEEDRYASHRPVPGSELVLLHGHVHEKWKRNGNQINVGVDVWDFYPVHENTIELMLAGRAS